MRLWGRRRIGHFRVARTLIEDGHGEVIFAGFTPLRVEMLYYENALDCVGLHADFEPIAAGECVPDYECLFELIPGETGITGLPTGEVTVTRTFRKH